MTAHKLPWSVLVVIYTTSRQVLLLKRADTPPGQVFWQSVTGSKDRASDSFVQTAVREVLEETGIDSEAPNCQLQDWGLENTYVIYPQWLHRYAPGVTHNTERVFGLCVPEGTSVRLSPREHTESVWLPWRAAADLCHSPSNAEAILLLPQFAV